VTPTVRHPVPVFLGSCLGPFQLLRASFSYDPPFFCGLKCGPFSPQSTSSYAGVTRPPSPSFLRSSRSRVFWSFPLLGPPLLDCPLHSSVWVPFIGRLLPPFTILFSSPFPLLLLLLRCAFVGRLFLWPRFSPTRRGDLCLKVAGGTLSPQPGFIHSTEPVLETRDPRVLLNVVSFPYQYSEAVFFVGEGRRSKSSGRIDLK